MDNLQAAKESHDPPTSGALWSSVLLVFLCLIRIEETNCLPITATFSSYHQNTEAGMDTNMEGNTYFSHYLERLTGTTLAFQLWNQPFMTEGPTVYLFSPKATQSSRSMGILSSYGKYFCRAMVLREIKDLYMICTGGTASLQTHYLAFDTLTNMYTTISWNNNNPLTYPWSLRLEPLFTDYMYYIDGLNNPLNYLYKWDTNQPARDPAPGILVGSNFCRSWQFLEQ